MRVAAGVRAIGAWPQLHASAEGTRPTASNGPAVATPQIMPLDLVAWALFRRGHSTEQVAAQTGLELEHAIEAIIRGFRLTLEEG